MGDAAQRRVKRPARGQRQRRDHRLVLGRAVPPPAGPGGEQDEEAGGERVTHIAERFEHGVHLPCPAPAAEVDSTPRISARPTARG